VFLIRIPVKIAPFKILALVSMHRVLTYPILGKHDTDMSSSANLEHDDRVSDRVPGAELVEFRPDSPSNGCKGAHLVASQPHDGNDATFKIQNLNENQE
jgi:hypothetical protein